MFIDDTIYTGRPADRRTEAEEAIYDKLDQLSIPYLRVDHDHADTMEDCRLIEEKLGARICKNLFLTTANKSKFYLLMMPGEKQFKTKELSKQINSSRLSFASAEHMEELMNLTPGSVTVLGLMNDPDNRVQLIMDEDVVKSEYIGCHPCINTSSLKLKTSDVLEKLLPAIGHEPIFVQL